MDSRLNVDPSNRHAKRGSASKAIVSRPTVMHAAGLWLAALIALAPTPARAVCWYLDQTLPPLERSRLACYRPMSR